MKSFIYSLIGVLMFSFIQPAIGAETIAKNAYDFSFKTLMGGEAMPLKEFKGKVLLIVNTASNCGFTKQYDGLEKLYNTYKDRGLVVIGVPSNDFGKQEPGSDKEIASFCKLNFGVTFPMASKEIVTGDKAHPFYIWVAKTLGFGSAPKWNFHKYLINRNGDAVDFFYSTTSPDSKRVIRAIERALIDQASIAE